MEVTALESYTGVVGGRLLVGLTTTVDADVYGTWTVDWDGVKQVTLSTRDRVTNGVLEFDGFFSDIYDIDHGDEVEVCITGHGGVSTCTPPDATLSALGVSETDGTAVVLAPVFAAATTAYTATVANDVETVTVTATTTDDNASVAFDPATDADTNTDGHQVALEVGENAITATVTIRGQTETYTVTVTRADTTLSALGLTDGAGNPVTLDPVFAAGTTSYTASVENDVATVTVAATATAAAAGATVAFDPAADADTNTPGHQVALDVGANTITATVTHGGQTEDYTVTVTRADTTLSALGVSETDGTAVTLDPVFAAGTTSYTATVENDVATVTVAATATAAAAGATVAFDPAADADTNTPGHQVALEVGANTITATVTHGGQTQDYTVTVTRADTTLSALSLTAGGNAVTLAPAFAAGTTAYAASVENDVTTVTVAATPTAATAGATVAFDPATDADTNTPGHQVSLSVGENTITATVTHGNLTEAYTITVTRTDTTLSALSVSETDGTAVTLDPVFAAGTTAYTASVANDVDIVTVAATAAAAGATVAFDPAADADSTTAGHQVSLSVGENTITATVTHGGLTGAYTITVTRTDTTLSALDLTDGGGNAVTLAPVFAAGTTAYTASVANDVDTVTVAATANAAGATVAFDPAADADSTTAGHQVSLSVGENTITATVSHGSLMEDYTITVTRTDTTLSALSLTAGGNPVTLDPVFAAGTTSYTVSVANDVDTVTVAATAAAAGATVAFDPAADADSTTAGHQVSLSVGENTITATVTHGSLTQAYTVTVTRTDLTLSALTLTDGSGTDVTLDPLFASATTSYMASVANDVDTVTVAATATAADAGATVAFDPAADADTNAEGHQVALDVGANTITATVTHGGQTQDYTLTVTRAGADTTLSALSLTGGGLGVALDPAFAAGTTAYTASVMNNVATVTVAATANANGATVAITPVDADTSTAGHQVDLSAGANTITATVTNGTAMREHTITVTREAASVLWSATLTVGSATDTRGFASGWIGSVGDMEAFNVPGTSPAVSVEVDDIIWDPATSQNALELNLDVLETSAEVSSIEGWVFHFGNHTVAIGSTAISTSTSGNRISFDSDFGDFFATSAKPATGAKVAVCLTTGSGATCPGGDVETTTLSALSLTDASGSAVPLSPGFATGTAAYTASVASDVSTVTVVATTTANDATVTFDPTTDADSTTAGHQFSLMPGENTITATVTDGTATQNYTITVTRADTTLSALGVSETDGTTVTLDPVFAAGTTAYTASVANDVTTVTVAATANAAGATVAFDPAADADDQTAGHQVSLSVGENTITATVTHGGLMEAYTVTVTRTDTTLSALTLTDGSDTDVTLDPVFAAGTTAYTASVANDVTTVTVAATATAIAAGATVAFDPAADADSSTAGHQVSLSVGENTITATVTHGSLTQAYTVTVTRTDLTLSALTLTDGSGTDVTLDPLFASGTTSYMATVANDVDTVTVAATATAAAAGATVALDPAADADTNAEGHQVALDVGANTITATVTHGGQTQDYTLTVTRAGADTTLSALGVSETDGTTVTLDPVFAAGTTSYTASVANDVDTVTVAATANDGGATVAFEPATDADSTTAGHQVALALGDTEITVTVTNGTETQDYTVTVTRAGALSALTLTDGSGAGVTLAPVFAAGTTSYTASVANDVDTVTVAATAGAADAGATVAFEPATDADGTTAGHQVSLMPGETTITVTVTDGTETQDYTVTVTRAVAAPLSALTLTAGGLAVALDPAFAANTTTYTASVMNNIETVTVAATAAEVGATVTITPADASMDDVADPSTLGHQITLTAGENTITVTVTNGTETQDYTVTVTREAASVLWAATVTVGSVGGSDGYKINSFGSLGAMDEEGFDVPGTSPAVSAEVEEVTWDSPANASSADTLRVDIELSETSVEPSSMEGWVFHFGNHEYEIASNHIVPFASAGGFTLAAINFGFFVDAAKPAAGTEVAVCLATGSGATCPGGDVETTTLSGLSLTDVNGAALPLSPGFAAGTTAYTASVTYGPTTQGTVTVAATATANDATVRFNRNDADRSTPGHQYSLRPGENTIRATVIDGTASQNYIITLTNNLIEGCESEDIWCAEMTVGDAVGFGGFARGNDFRCGTCGSTHIGTLRSPEFLSGRDTIEILNLGWRTLTGTNLRGAQFFELTPGPAPGGIGHRAWTLHIGDSTRDLADFNTWTGETGLFLANFWTASNPPPAAGDTVLVRLTATATGSTGASASGLEARFGVQPAWHTGMPFWTELHFSEEPDVGYKDLRDKAFEVTGARITRAQRIDKGSKRSWRLLVVPDGFGDISLTLPATEDCAAEGAVCTADGARLETGLALAVPGPGDRLAARMKGTSTHTGEAFFLKLHFNHEPNLGYRDVRDKLFAETGGRVSRAQRLVKGSNLGWRLTVEPEGLGDVGLELPATESCSAEGAVCTKDGRKLERGISWTVQGPPAFSVSDAEVEEEPGAVLAFEVSLSRRLRAEARVDVATVDGTATAGSDYEAVTRTLVFAPGETLKTVEVVVLDDAHDEGEETMTLVLSNAEGALIDDGEGTGTIVNNDAIPKAWIARFGRTVTGQVLDAVEARLAAPREAGGRMSLAGYALVDPGRAGGRTGTGGGAQTPTQATLEDRAAVAALGDRMDGARTGRSQAQRERRIGGPEPKSLDITRHRLVTGTAFTLSAGSAEDGGFASLWGHASVASFDGREDALTLDGEVTTGFLGADWVADPGSGSGAGRWTAGLALGHSAGTGGYRDGECEADGAQSGACSGRIEAELTGLYPYAGLDVTERISVWLAGGHGAGELTVIPDGSGAIGTDLAMHMGAAGTRIAVLGSEGGEGLNLALKATGASRARRPMRRAHRTAATSPRPRPTCGCCASAWRAPGPSRSARTERETPPGRR